MLFGECVLFDAKNGSIERFNRCANEKFIFLLFLVIYKFILINYPNIDNVSQFILAYYMSYYFITLYVVFVF